MSEVAKRRVSLHSLHLLWTVPLAFAIGYFPASVVRFERCGFRQCLGEPVGFASPSASDALGVAALAAVAILGALALTPWLRPLWLRIVVAVAVAVVVFVFWVWRILFY